MAETSQYTDLLTPDDVRMDALNSLNFDVTSTDEAAGLGGSYKDVCIRAIQDVSSAIESYLDRKLIVRKHMIDIPNYKWEYNRALEQNQHYPKHWPIVQVETSGVSISNDSVRLISGTTNTIVDLYAGFKRKDQDLNDLQSELPDLEEEPDDLPEKVRRVAFRLVMYELTMASQNTFGVGSVVKSTGQTTAEITKPRMDVYDEELEKLHNLRWVL